MLLLSIPSKEYYDEIRNEFFSVPGGTLELEHSLFAIAQWESKWKKSFINSKELTGTEILDYIKCMSLSSAVDPSIYNNITAEQIGEVMGYINSKQTATTFSGPKEKASGRVVTVELVYCWMFSLNIPLECEHWNFDRLTTLIRVCVLENGPQKKMSKKETAQMYRDINRARRKKIHTKG